MPESSGSWPPSARARAAVAHSLVNGVGVIALASMHLWGSLGAEWAAGGILALCGLWAHHTRKGPPGGPPGVAGALALAARVAESLRPPPGA